MMTMHWLHECYYESVQGRDWPPIILMAEDSYREYSGIISFKMNRANAPLPDSLTIFQGAVVAVDKELNPMTIKVLSNDGSSKRYEIPA